MILCVLTIIFGCNFLWGCLDRMHFCWGLVFGDAPARCISVLNKQFLRLWDTDLLGGPLPPRLWWSWILVLKENIILEISENFSKGWTTRADQNMSKRIVELNQWPHHPWYNATWQAYGGGSLLRCSHWRCCDDLRGFAYSTLAPKVGTSQILTIGTSWMIAQWLNWRFWIWKCIQYMYRLYRHT